MDGGLYDQNNKRRRIIAVLNDAPSDDALIEKAVHLAHDSNSHLRFVYAVDEFDRQDSSISFPTFVQMTRDRMNVSLKERLDALNDDDSIQGGELVVMGFNKAMRGATIDEPAGLTPQFISEMLIKPFNPDLVVCKQDKKSLLGRLFHSSASDYFKRKLTCDVEVID